MPNSKAVFSWSVALVFGFFFALPTAYLADYLLISFYQDYFYSRGTIFLIFLVIFSFLISLLLHFGFSKKKENAIDKTLIQAFGWLILIFSLLLIVLIVISYRLPNFGVILSIGFVASSIGVIDLKKWGLYLISSFNFILLLDLVRQLFPRGYVSTGYNMGFGVVLILSIPLSLIVSWFLLKRKEFS